MIRYTIAACLGLYIRKLHEIKIYAAKGYNKSNITLFAEVKNGASGNARKCAFMGNCGTKCTFQLNFIFTSRKTIELIFLWYNFN